MLATFLSGLGTGAGLIIAIGAQNAFVLRQGLLRQHVLPVVLVCIGGDILCICAGVAGMGALIRTNEWLLEFFRWGGALFLTVYGISAARRAASGNGFNGDFGGRCGLTHEGNHIVSGLHISKSARLSGYGRAARLHCRSVRQGFEVDICLGALTASVLWFTGLGFGARLLLPIFQNPKAWRILDTLIALVMWAIALTLVLNPIG